MHYYTNPVRSDAFGAQYQGILFCILQTELEYKGTFVLTTPDFKTVYGERAEEMYDIMGLQGHYKNRETLHHNATIVELKHWWDTYKFVENNLDMCVSSPTMENIRRLFHEKNNDCCSAYLPRSDTTIHVAIHIRRPSMHANIDLAAHHDGLEVKEMGIQELANVNQRFAPDERYLRVIETLRMLHNRDGKRCCFHIVSEGPEDRFRAFDAPDIVKHLNEPVRDSFCMLVHADVLVTCSSSFSYIAGILSKKEVWYQPFWHKAPSHWKEY